MVRPLTSSEAHAADDTVLVERVRAGEEPAFTELVVRYHPLLVRTAGALVQSRAIAEELAQETWMVALQKLDSFEGRGSLAGWLARIAANRARNVLQREGRSAALDTAAEGDAPTVDPRRFDASGDWERPPRRWNSETPELLLARTEARAAFEAAVATLPAMQRAVVTLRDVDGLSSESVCAALEISESNQRVLLHRARSRLREVLERYADAL